MQTNFNRINEPILVLDETKCTSNILRMCIKAEKNKVAFRPHFKTHQSKYIGKIFRKCGVGKIAVSSLPMADYFAKGGWQDITIAFPFIPGDAEALKKLSLKANISIFVSNLFTAQWLNRNARFPLGVFLEVDAGYKRTGFDVNDVQSVIKSLNLLRKNRNLNVHGISSHFGNSYGAGAGNVKAVWDVSVQKLTGLRRKAGDESLIISAGDTPCCSVLDDFTGVDEIRPGNFVFYDVMQYTSGICSAEEIAVSVFCPVVDTHPERSEFTVRCGAVHLSKEFIVTSGGDKIYGLICKVNNGVPAKPVNDSFLVNLTQEHGVAKAPKNFIQSLRPGDTVAVLPVHSCLTAQNWKSYVSAGGKIIGKML